MALEAWWPLLVVPLLALGVMGGIWWVTGQDVDPVAGTRPACRPPEGLTPVEIGTLLDETCDVRDVLATLFDLAARGYLQIGELPGERKQGTWTPDYVFFECDKTLDLAAVPLHAYERDLLAAIFGEGVHPDRVKLSYLKGRISARLPDVRNGVYDALVRKGLFTTNPAVTRAIYQAIGVGLLGGALALGWRYDVWGATAIAWGVGVAIAGLIVLGFAPAMPAKTTRGSRLLGECRGFQRFALSKDPQRVQESLAQNPDAFMTYLSHALVLGVAKEWADAFEQSAMSAPDWLVPLEGWGAFAPTHLANRLQRARDTMVEQFASTEPVRRPNEAEYGTGVRGPWA